MNTSNDINILFLIGIATSSISIAIKTLYVVTSTISRVMNLIIEGTSIIIISTLNLKTIFSILVIERDISI